MKTHRLGIAATGAAGILVLILSGCSSLPFGLGGNSKNKEKQDAVLPTDREHLHSSRNDTKFSAKDLEAGTVTGDWAIDSVYGQTPVSETAAFLKFVPAEKRVYGNNGCNTLNAEYLYDSATKSLRFDKMVSTLRMCGTPGITDSEINAALDATRSYSWGHQDDKYYLDFYDENGIKLMTLVHQNFDFLNGSWQVTAIEDEPIDDPEMQLVIDTDEGKIHGNTGCNILNGKIDIDMETVNTISFHDIITTRMACPNPENQTRLIVALEDAAHAKPVDAKTVILLNLLRKPVLTLRRI